MSTRVMIVGGFLGAGKTTLLLEAARQLTTRGYKVGLVTNDQGRNLVDTALVKAQEYPVTEVSGGCFCCNFPDLVGALERLYRDVNPDIVLAEPVGSCTDLVATTLRPLAAYYPGQFEVAPLSILIDPLRELALLPPDVDYLYRRQLAEAEFAILNKTDRLSAEEQKRQLDSIKFLCPNARVMALSALTGDGVAEWLESGLGMVNDSPETMDLDYARYADAEAALGWLNASGRVNADAPFSVVEWTTHLLEWLGEACITQNVPIAHIKVHVNAGNAAYKASLTRADLPITWSLHPEDVSTAQIDFILNARVNTTPTILEALTHRAIEAVKIDAGVRHYFTHFECFSPLPPNPTYRLGADRKAITR